MTINDMLEQGVVLQGHIEVRQYNSDADDYETVYDEWEDNGLMSRIDEPWADMHVGYIYSPYGRNGLTIEVAAE